MLLPQFLWLFQEFALPATSKGGEFRNCTTTRKTLLLNSDTAFY